jgi:hypothetical protein
MAFNLPLQNFFQKRVEPTDWVRPSDWPVITDDPNEVQFLMSDVNDASCTIRTAFTRTSGSQNIVIDWGDGNTDTISTNATTDTTHQYVVGSGTPCSRGYTTFRVRVYFTGTGVSVLNACRLFGILFGGNVNNYFYNVGLLEAYYGDGTQTFSMLSYFNSNAVSTTSISTYNYLEYVKLPATVGWTSFNDTFSGCYSLAKVIMPTSASAMTTLANTFASCFALREIVLPSNATAISTLNTTFTNCFQLRSVTLPLSLNSCTSFSNTFTNCFSLKNVTVPSINSCNSLQQTFQGCTSLEWVRFTSLPTTPTVSATSLFASSPNLQNVYFPATCSSSTNYTFNQAFQNCSGLKSVVLPSGFNPNTLLNAFSGCSTLVRCIFQSGASNLNDMSSSFLNCTNLTSVTLPSSVSSSGISLSSTFSGCSSLKTITIPSSYLITTMLTTFSGCNSLQKIDWTPGAQNSLISLNQTFNNCILLQSITLPTSMNAVNDMTSTFNNCRCLITVTLPLSLNAVTSIAGAFQNCVSLMSVKLPTSMSSCTSFASMFNGCSVIRSITMPATVSTVASNFATAFGACSALSTLIFPSAAQLSSVTAINNMLQYCSNLTTITNFDKIGSLSATPLVNAGNNGYARLTSISFVMPLSQLSLIGGTATAKTDVQSVRLLNTSAGQWTGVSPQINVSFTNMSTANLVQLFNDMAAQGNVVGKTINITSATGAAGLTTANRQIITNRGWTITG